MRNNLLPALLLIICLSACSKNEISAPHAMATSADDLSISPTATNFQLLTAHTWMYKKYYVNSVSPENLGELVYDSGKPVNTLDLTLNRVTFNPDGTVTEIDQFGNYVPGSWEFLNAAQTKMVVRNAYGEFVSYIMKLTKKDFRWTNLDSKTSAQMSPENQ